MKLRKLIIVLLLLISTGNFLFSSISGSEFWKKNSKGNVYFVQGNFDSKYASDNAYKVGEIKTVKAKIEDKWNTYQLIDLPQKFIDWNIGERINGLEQIKKGLPPKGMLGTHDPAIATYGSKRDDSLFALNNAIKGVGYLPKENEIDNVILLLKENLKNDVGTRLEVLIDLYKNFDKYFDPSKITSMELYSTPERCSQTFLNQMTNPVSVMVFTNHYPNYKLKTITALISPFNPNLTEYEKKIVEYVNLIYSFFHSPNKLSQGIVSVYYIVEAYDNTPGPGGGGTKMSPVNK